MKQYNASYTGREFLAFDDPSVHYLCWRGPVGNGKSVGCIFKIYKYSSEQYPIEIEEDGVKKSIRWSKWLIARHTHKALNETTIESWNEWMGDHTAWHGQMSNGRYEEKLSDGTILRMDFVCHATESPNIMGDLQSLELSGAWVNEAIYTPLNVITRIQSRIGRFNPNPQMKVKLKEFPVIMDTNSPDETNWWYSKEVIEKPEDWRFFVSPPALLVRKDVQTGKYKYVPNRGQDFEKSGIRAAENVKETDGGFHDGFKYWLKQVSGNDPDEVRKLILNQFGTSVAGMPVFGEFTEGHVVKDVIHVQRGMAILIGMDLGRTPAAVIGQMGPDGVLRAICEVTTWDNRLCNGAGGLRRMDVGQFADELLKPVLVNRFGYPNCRHMCFCDPAGKNFNEVVSVSAIEMLNRHGIRAVACDKQGTGYSFEQKNANEIGMRLRCVSENLRRMCNGVPAIQIADECKMLVKGFRGKYCYKKMRIGSAGEERYAEEPDKNDYSHVMDGFGYLCIAAFYGGVDYSRPSDMIGNVNISGFGMELGCDCV